MPVLICPRCRHVNPEYATYCCFDGVVLQAQQNAAVLRLPKEFAFPSGRRCQTFDELAQGCQEEWTAARDLLMRGVFAQFFRSCNRADLVRAADDAKVQSSPDIALMTFVNALPGERTATPKVDLSPRRILVGSLLVGESKSSSLTITNTGQGMLQGTISVTEGQDWLSLSDTGPVHEVAVEAVREQLVKLRINTKGVAAGQAYSARLTIVTNGGVVEVPLKMNLAAQPYPKAPFQGVRTQRELAEKMRQHAKASVPILESGDIQRWFAVNGWIYPVQGTPVKGVAGVQQFFEGIGKSKPPIVTLSQNEFRYTVKYKDTVRGSVTLETKDKKWVYAHVASDSPWLHVVNPQISGPQRATLPFEVDTSKWNQGPIAEGKMTFQCNGGQKLTLKVTVEVLGGPSIQKPKPAPPVATSTMEMPAVPSATFAAGEPPLTAARAIAPALSVERAKGVKFIPAVVTTVVVCLALRVLLVPFVDCWGRSSVASSAAEKMQVKPTAESPLKANGGWLRLPWLTILAGSDAKFSAAVFQPGNNAQLSTLEFRHYFATYFIRWFVFWTAWLGVIVGAVMVLRRGGFVDLPWGIVAGAAAGFAVSATLAAVFLVIEMIPHTLWHLIPGEHGGVGFLILWIVIAVFCWLLVGIALGIVLPLVAPLRRLLIDPFQSLFAAGFRIAGMSALADYWSPT